MTETYKAYLYAGDRNAHIGESPQGLPSVDFARDQGMNCSIHPTSTKPDYFEIKESNGDLIERWELSEDSTNRWVQLT